MRCLRHLSKPRYVPPNGYVVTACGHMIVPCNYCDRGEFSREAVATPPPPRTADDCRSDNIHARVHCQITMPVGGSDLNVRRRETSNNGAVLRGAVSPTQLVCVSGAFMQSSKSGRARKAVTAETNTVLAAAVLLFCPNTNTLTADADASEYFSGRNASPYVQARAR